jgi:CBS domain-containing protein/CheY-like chemotaxis protein
MDDEQPLSLSRELLPGSPGLRPKQPVLLDLSHDAAEPGRIPQDLQARYGQNYRLARASSAEQALEQLTNSKEKHESVALMLVNQALPAMNGTEFLAEAATYFPEARKVLIATAKDTEAAITGINQLGIHHYLVLPWRPESILPILDELLDDWQATVELSYLRVKGIMETRVARIRADSNLHHAAEIVAMSGVSDLMVVDHNGDFVGVLSEGDILRAALPDFDEILEQGGALRDAYQAFLRKGRELSQKPILPLIIREPITLQPDDHVAKAAAVLIGKQIRRLPVLKDGRLIGTVSRANICEAVVGTL